MLDGMLIKSGVIFYAANNILHTLNNECYLMRPAIRLYVHIHIYIHLSCDSWDSHNGITHALRENAVNFVSNMLRHYTAMDIYWGLRLRLDNNGRRVICSLDHMLGPDIMK